MVDDRSTGPEDRECRMCGYHRVEETWTRPRDTWPGVLIHERRCPRCGDYERTETLDEGV